MKIQIYRERVLGQELGLGGAEFVVAALAEAFERDHDVEILSDHPGLRPGAIAATFGIHLTRTRFRDLAPEAPPRSRTPWGLYRHAAGALAEVGRSYDRFLCITHGIPPFCPARSGLLLILFPNTCPADLWPWNEPPARGPGRIRQGLRNGLYAWIWHRRFRSYRTVAMISEFTRHWTRRWWGIDGHVIYPPVEIRARPAPKQPLILSVGRFTPRKKQLEMIEAFGAWSRSDLASWTLQCIGNLGGDPESRAYLARLEHAARDHPIRLTTDVDRAGLDVALGQASIFWHAMGHGQDTDPYLMEHFGIATVEAMAAGCVPVVINRGGQAEIVRHGVDGFLWETLEELREYTARLVRDEALRTRMADAARARAARFSKAAFIENISKYLFDGSGRPAGDA